MTRKKSWKELIAAINKTMRLWKVKRYSIEPKDAPARRDRYHSSEQRRVTVRFVPPAVRLFDSNRQIVLCFDTKSVAHDNLELLAAALETIRLGQSRGIEPLLMAAYRQLDPIAVAEAPRHKNNQLNSSDPYAILGVEPHYPLAVIETIWKAKLRVEHPDAGGDGAKAARLNEAMDEIRKRKKNN